MELHQLEYFVAVAEEANFTRAAQRVHISQSGVSAQVKQLERDLGAALIDRSGRTATLTTAGFAAIGHARSVLASVHALRQAVDDVRDVVRGRLEVGMVTACTVVPLFDALAAFHLAHPGVEVALTEDSSDRLIQRVRTGATDMALVGAAGAPPDGLAALPIVSERLVAAVPPGHRLATRRRATVREISEDPIVCLPCGTGIRTVFDEGCVALGLRPDIALQATAPDTVADLAARGLGTAILTSSIAARHADRLHAVTISDITTPAVLALVWAPVVTSPALRELLVHARRAFSPRPS